MVRRISFADLTHTGQLVASNTFPYGVCLVAAYAERYFDGALDIFVCKYPSDFSEYLDQGIPHIACFSNYSWNCSLAYAFARRLKQIAPDTVVIFGGPNYPLTLDEQRRFLEQHQAIDFYIQFEGERALLALLKELESCDWNVQVFKQTHRPIPSVHYLVHGTLIHGEHAGRITQLDEIPSPYLTGRCDKFFDGVLIPMLQTNRGCPFRCTFCTEGQDYYNKVHCYSSRRVIDDLTYIAERATVPDLIIVDSNFGMFKEDVAVARYLSELQHVYGWPRYIHVSTGKNNKERVLEVAELVKGAMSFSATIQSSDPRVLQNIKRSNISIDQLITVAKNAGRIGANSYSEIILGLPGDSVSAHRHSILSMADADVNVIRMYQLMMLPGSELARPECRQRYRMKTRFRVMPRNFGCYRFAHEQFACGEIEEICVANDTLSFSDYVTCREFNLTVELFYNGGVFEELIQFLKWKNVRPSQFLEAVHEHILTEASSVLTEIYTGFRRETIHALSLSPEELLDQLADPRAVQQYISEEKGNNELFKYRALGFFIIWTHCTMRRFRLLKAY